MAKVNYENIQAINWAKVIGNTITAFCLTLLGTVTAGVPIDVTQPAIITAIVTGLLALGTELKKEGDECEPTLAKKVRSTLLIF